uniref:Uncharacterized protein n=1 Tax=Meloidogyne enterolobii TaxID=390850 RepID=A0A6V7WPC6_MELEN|nr:unnamed protein product [Meloidogyne enterolobii]
MINFLGNYEDMMTELEINYFKELRKQIIGKEEINLVINSPKCEKSRGGFLLSACTRNSINVIEPIGKSNTNNEVSNVKLIEEEKLKNKFERSSAICFSLRKYLCDVNFNRTPKWENVEKCDSKAENCEEMKRIKNKHERIFRRFFII